MNSLFQRASSRWVRYGEYELKKGGDGRLYVTPTAEAAPKIYDPLKNAERIVLDALNVGLLCMDRAGEEKIRRAVMEFVSHYGLLGLMTALPTTPYFMNYEAVYLPKNHFIKSGTMKARDYVALFFPFEKLDVRKEGKSASWNMSDRMMAALAMTMGDKPMAVNMSFQREYAERYDWLVRQFKDWAFTFSASFLYYEDYDEADETTRELYRQGMAAFDGIAPTYHIALLDKPAIIWDFHSLLLCVQMMFSLMLTDGSKPLRICKQCGRAFMASRPSAVFCSPQCKNRYNVYKSRARD